MQVSPAFALIQSPELVRSTNAWMAAFFGCTDLIPDGTVYELKMYNTLVMNQRTYNKLKEAASHGE